MSGLVGADDEDQPLGRGRRRRFLKAQRVFQTFGKRRRALVSALIILLALFAAIALLEQRLVHWQFYRTSQAELAAAARTIRDQIQYSPLNNKLDLKQYRNTPAPIPLYCLIGSDGLLIDTGGVIPGVLGKVDLPFDDVFRAAQTVSTAANETWRLRGRKVDGGYVIVGIQMQDRVPNVSGITAMIEYDPKLERSLKAFGSTLSEATATKLRDVDPDVEYAVVSSSGELKSAWGGIPIKTEMNALPLSSDHVARLTGNGKPYLLYYQTIQDVFRRPVVTIVVGKELDFEEQALGNFDRLNYWIVGGALTFLVLVALTLLARELLRHTNTVSLEEALKVGESRTIEFKSAFQWDSSHQIRCTLQAALW